MSGAAPAPPIEEGTLAANAACGLATSREPLPGNGPAVAEHWPTAAPAAADEESDAEVAAINEAAASQGSGADAQGDDAPEAQQFGSETEIDESAEAQAPEDDDATQPPSQPSQIVEPASAAAPAAPLRPLTTAHRSNDGSRQRAEIAIDEPAQSGAAAPTSQQSAVVAPLAAVPAARKPDAAPAATEQPVVAVAVHRPIEPPSKRRKKARAAAKRAVAAMNADEEAFDEDSPAEVKRSKVATAACEASLAEALGGKFSRFEPLLSPPPWLPESLQPDSETASRLHGELIAFNCMSSTPRNPQV